MSRPTAKQRRGLVANLAVAQQIAMTIDTMPSHITVDEELVRVYLHRDPSAVEAFALRFDVKVTAAPHRESAVMTTATGELGGTNIEAWSLDEAPQEPTAGDGDE